MITAFTRIAQCKQRWLDFYDLSGPTRHMFVLRYAPDLPVRPYPTPWLKRERLDWIWANYEWHLGRMGWLDDDTLPCLDMLTGTELFAEAFGCSIHYPADNMPFAQPLVFSPADADRLRVPALDCAPIALVFDMADELYRRAGPGVLTRMVDVQSPMDVAALIWEKTSFYAALVEAPEAVLALSEKIKALQFNFLDEWFRRYGRAFVAHYPEYYMPQGVTMSVDEIGAVSPDMFNRFFLPELVEHSGRYGGIGIHCCANARHQWANFKRVPNLRLLNLNQPEAVAREAVGFFGGHVPLWFVGWDLPAGTLADWAALIPPQVRLVFDLTAPDREAALRLSDQLAKLCRG
jgi:hypothetical protein